MDTTTDECGPSDTNQLYGDHVVGKDIGVVHRHAGVLLSPTLETQVGDVDVEREEDDEAGDGEEGDAQSASCGSEAVLHFIIQADGGRGKMRGKGGVRGGRGAG